MLRQLKELLHEQDVTPELSEDILMLLREQLNSGESVAEQVEHSFRHKFSEWLSASPVQGISSQTRLVHFVGPTGVGKTTTIAKLAAEQVLKHHRKVGLITADTYRIAAVEQLRTYSSILDLPLEVVNSPQDLKKSLEAFKDLDIVFMDTAGRNFRNEMYVSEVNSLLTNHTDSETYLVLSLTMKYSDMKVIAANFSKFKLDKVLFTKMDETHTFGAIINLIKEFPLKLSYVTTGQNVPDDIEKIDPARITELILSGWPHE